MGRSLDISGPYVDKDNVSLLDGGGTTVYASNHNGQVYAPGSCGVLSIDSDKDVLFYHYSKHNPFLLAAYTSY
jgi:arabinan endo-1,5-alpha-L-arabinosidase